MFKDLSFNIEFDYGCYFHIFLLFYPKYTLTTNSKFQILMSVSVLHVYKVFVQIIYTLTHVIVSQDIPGQTVKQVK